MKQRVLCVYILFVLSFSLTPALEGRDINLDSVYIDTGSGLYSRLLEKKLEAYQIAGAQFVDRDVIFACWGDGNTIIYVKEAPRINVIHSFNRTTRKNQELFRLTGTITAVKNSANGRYLFIKRLIGDTGSMPRGETQVLDLYVKKSTALESVYPFLDFSLAAGGNTILLETAEGIVEYAPDTGKKTIAVRKKEYADIGQAGAPVIAYQSPNKKLLALVSGSGGSYRGKIVTSGASWQLPGITSASEFFWIDNTRLVYRKGFAGSFSVNLYDTASRKTSELISNSLNTNIQFSVFPKIISFLQDQVIHAYDTRRFEKITIGLEGEDVSFSPDGNRFISLYLGKLFVTSLATVKKKNIEMAKTAKEITALYRNLLDAKKDQANEYSPEYIRKKISVYSKMAE